MFFYMYIFRMNLTEIPLRFQWNFVQNPTGISLGYGWDLSGISLRSRFQWKNWSKSQWDFTGIWVRSVLSRWNLSGIPSEIPLKNLVEIPVGFHRDLTYIPVKSQWDFNQISQWNHTEILLKSRWDFTGISISFSLGNSLQFDLVT